MGLWNSIYSIRDQLRGITPDVSTVKRAGGTAYTAAAKIDQVVRVDAIQKLPQYLPDSETKAKICIFTTKLAKNAGKYAVNEGFKHIPGATVVTKLISDTMREVKQETDKDGKKVKTDTPEQDSPLSKLQLELVSQNRNLSLQNADKRDVKGSAAHSYSSAAAAKIDQVVRVDEIEKLPQYLPHSVSRAQISLFTTKLAKYAGKYVVSEGFKHISGRYSLFLSSLSLKLTRGVEDSQITINDTSKSGVCLLPRDKVVRIT